jgi:PAS domain S-box-containing protein
VWRGPELVYELANPAYHRFAPGKEFLGRTYAEVWPEAVEPFVSNIRRVMETGELWSISNVPARIRRGPTSPLEEGFWNILYVALPPDDSGRAGVLCLATEIASQMRVTEALRESEDQYRQLVEQAGDGIFQLDAQGNFVLVNEAICRMLGYGREELLSRNILDTYLAADQETARQRLPAIPAERVLHFDREMVRKDGSTFLISAAAVRLADGRLQAIVHDITDRKRAEDALRSSQAELRAIYEHAPMMMCVVDRERRVRYANHAMAAFTGTPEEILKGGRACGILGCIHAAEDPRGCGHGPQCETCSLRLAMLDTLQTGKVHVGIEYSRTLEIAGKRRSMAFIGSTALIRDGADPLLLLCFIDITDRVRAEEEKLELERRLLHAQKLESIGILAGGIAHDFNNILAGIMGYTELLRLAISPSDPAQTDLDVIKSLVRRAADLTRQMLAYAGQGKFVAKPIDLSRLVADTRELLVAGISKKAVLEFDLAADLPNIQADPSQIQQVVLNLIGNASESLGEKPGTITVRTDAVRLRGADCTDLEDGTELREGIYVRLEVADTGCGMEPGTLKKIFEPFFTTKFTGRGLGLAAVHGIVRGHKGGIQVSSQPTRGTIFRVLFPASDPSTSSARSTVAANRGSGTVLVVDDEEAVRGFVRRMLQPAGYPVLTASDGEEAVRVYREHRHEIACVLLDLTMPKLSGVETFLELRKVCPEVRVVLTSGYSEENALEQFAGLGLAGFIQKPFQLETMVAVLNEAISDAQRPSPTC